jgi:hypothetical protein
MFSEKDLEKAIKDGIFNSSIEVTSNPSEIIRYFEKWADLKYKEVAKNIRHKANDLYYNHTEQDTDKLIMNIRYDDVKPKED